METSLGDLSELVLRLRTIGAELTNVEVKASVGALPKSIWPTVSAFSNHGGGVLLLGLQEDNDFAPAPGFDAEAIRDAVADAFRPRRHNEVAGPITPRPIGAIEIGEVDGRPIVVVDVEELPPGQKPAFVTTQGKESGTYERVGDGDRRMSTYGVFLLSTSGQQPRDDARPVDGATLTDLDRNEVLRFIEQLKRTRPRSIADLHTTEQILRRHNVLSQDESTPSVAGLLALGRYPQQFLPQAMITFAVYPGRSKSNIVGDVRMLDRKVIEGPIPVMVEDAVRAVLANLKTRRVSRGAGAYDEPEVPVDAIREAVVNALTHRDYSEWALGEQVRIEMYPDRIEFANPGDIWGGRSVVDLFDGVSRSRNAVLAALLTEVPLPGREETVSENAGSGVPRMAGAMGRAGLGAPVFDVTATNVILTLERHGLLDPETAYWLDNIGASRLDADSQMALVMVHRNVPIDDQVLRTTFGMDSGDARSLLQRLAQAGWLRYPVRPAEPYRRGPRFEAAERNAGSLLGESGTEFEVGNQPTPLDERILRAVRGAGELSVSDIAERVNSTPNAVRPRLRVLVAQGALIPTAPPTSRRRRYRLGSRSAGDFRSGDHDLLT
ncbi:ATP-binding protein [Agromyces sp. NPDC049794]|uniref:ATP-binding protein n=1 Tax=unclassified Agromyces TaxID=2639701 RepID=UPI0034060D9D